LQQFVFLPEMSDFFALGGASRHPFKRIRKQKIF
jgi:hypothetical protein